MADVKISYQTAVPITLVVSGMTTLANGSIAVSDAIDNTTNKYIDYLVDVSPTVGGTSGNKRVLFYAVSSLDGTNYSDTANDLGNSKQIGQLYCPTAGTTGYQSGAMSLAAVFGGRMPPYAKVAVKNDTGVAFTAATARVLGVYETVT